MCVLRERHHHIQNSQRGSSASGELEALRSAQATSDAEAKAQGQVAAADERAQLERENAGLAHTVHRLRAEAAAGAMGLEPSHHREPAAAAKPARPAAKLPLPLKAASEASANSPLASKAARPKTAGAKAAAAAKPGRGKKKEGGGGQMHQGAAQHVQLLVPPQ